ncbi:hypothetical protein QQP08_021515 [Theobroma cacao]|nr:hypothetical protein QQP08_021515 [Theobroma cacao]
MAYGIELIVQRLVRLMRSVVTKIYKRKSVLRMHGIMLLMMKFVGFQINLLVSFFHISNLVFMFSCHVFHISITSYKAH